MDNAWYVWLIIFIVSLILELATVGLTSVWFSIAALLTLILSLIPDFPFYAQTIVFFVVSILLLILVRPFIKKLSDKDTIRTNADKVISVIATVTKKICVGEIGEVRINTELWRAISLDTSDIEVGEKVVVNSLNGNKVLVSKISKKDDVEIV